VQDTGIGIPESQLPAIFDMFTQVEQFREQPRQGLGIGLALVKLIVELHGGSVQAASAGAGQGSIFTLHVPLGEPHSDLNTIPETQGAPGAAQTQALHILVVDDDADVAKSTAMLLETCGHQVCTVQDGAAAIEAACRCRPDVILLDIGMPGMNGYEVACRLRQEPTLQDTRLIALTGWGQEADRQRSQAAGFDHHLVKPVNLAALEMLLRNVRKASGAEGRKKPESDACI
jgi:CheY-like chemotaxis protein